MPSLDALKLAKDVFDAFTTELSKSVGKDVPRWSELSGNERQAFRMAIEKVIIHQIEMLALDMKLDDMMSDVLGDQKPKRVVEQRKAIPLGPGEICYYCGRAPAIKWYACAGCLRS